MIFWKASSCEDGGCFLANVALHRMYRCKGLLLYPLFPMFCSINEPAIRFQASDIPRLVFVHSCAPVRHRVRPYSSDSTRVLAAKYVKRAPLCRGRTSKRRDSWELCVHLSSCGIYWGHNRWPWGIILSRPSRWCKRSPGEESLRNSGVNVPPAVEGRRPWRARPWCLAWCVLRSPGGEGIPWEPWR